MPRASKRSKSKTTQQKVEQKLEQIMQRVAYFGGGYGVEAMRFTRNRLENLGSGIESINKKNAITLNYLPADLAKGKESLFTDNPFVEHTIKSTSKLVGKRHIFYTDILKKLMPDAKPDVSNVGSDNVDSDNVGSKQTDSENVSFDKTVDKFTDMIFEQVAGFASGWSKLHLSDERRFNLHMMTDTQRNTVARDIANQNRALATLCGIASSKGLIGMFIDAIWLLIISLRAIYQLSAVYGQPLKGKEGIQKAYSIIASSDLGKMHDKQTLMTGLGIAQSMLDKMESEGVRHGLKQQFKNFDDINDSDNLNGNTEKTNANNDNNSNSKSQSKNDGNSDNISQYARKIRHYLQQIEEVSDQFNLEIDDVLSHIKFNKIQKILPLASGTIGAYYNSQLIEQIIGTTQATFAPELKVVKEVQVDE